MDQRELRNRLRDALEREIPSPRISAEESLIRGGRRLRRQRALSGLAALSVLLIGVVATARFAGTDDVIRPSENNSKSSWTVLPPSPLAPRSGHSAVWTGTEVLIWGGEDGGKFFGDGAAFDPETEQWRPLARSPLAGRSAHSAVWTGTEMLIWGGAQGGHDVFDGGAAYDPSTDNWRELPEGPAGRFNHSTVWTGEEMIVWGGTSGEGLPALGSGASYDPRRDQWEPISAAPIDPRLGHAAAWDGRRMIVWGGADYSSDEPQPFADGATYDPSSDQWSLLHGDSTVTGRIGHAVFWVNDSLVITGGGGAAGPERSVAIWSEKGGWSTHKSEVPGSIGVAAVSVSDSLIALWGGSIDGGLQQLTSEGATFRPESSTWDGFDESPLEPRAFSSAVPTPEGIMIWGGHAGQRYFSDGAVVALD